MTTKQTTAIITKLFDIGAVKIDFDKGWTLKSGMWSPIYINLRILQSYPKLLAAIAKEMTVVIKKKKLSYDHIASIPLGGVALGVALSLTTGKGHVLPRMDSKKHGLGVKIDGVYKKGDKVLLVDDLITKATSKFEAIDELTVAKLKVKDVIVVLDREQGGKEELKEKGFRLHSLMTMSELLDNLVAKKKISKAVFDKLEAYFKKSVKPV